MYVNYIDQVEMDIVQAKTKRSEEYEVMEPIKKEVDPKAAQNEDPVFSSNPNKDYQKHYLSGLEYFKD